MPKTRRPATRKPRKNLRWEPILDRARELAEQFTVDQGVPPTLRQVHYALLGFAPDGIPYAARHYGSLSSRTAELRRPPDVCFPRLADATRGIVQAPSWEDPADALAWTATQYRRDRTAGQEEALYLGIEKRGMTVQLQAWFGDDLGLPILPLGGTSSESFEQDAIEHQAHDGRRSVLIYAGDWDASGEIIARNFTRWVPFDKVIHVALSVEQVFEHDLPLVEGNFDTEKKNTHWPQFRDRYRQELLALGWDGNEDQPVGVEVDALPVDVLRAGFSEAIAEFWDDDAHQDVLAEEREERAALLKIARRQRGK